MSNEQLITFGVCGLLAYGLIVGSYKILLRPLFCMLVEKRLADYREELAQLCRQHGIGLDAFPASYLNREFEKMRENLSVLSVSTYIHYKVLKLEYVFSEDYQRFQTEAPEDFKKLRDRATCTLTKWMAVNSPGWTGVLFVLIVVLIAGVFFHYAVKTWLAKQAALFVDSTLHARPA